MLLGSRDGLFFSRWLRRPLRTGALVPSGSELARLMAAQVDPTADDLVVELGGGTGVITQALLQAGVAPERLVVIEQDEQLHRLLAKNFPSATVVCGDAGQLGTILADLGHAKVGTAVSSLPFLAMSERRRLAILREIFTCLGPDGLLVQYTYRPVVPIVAAELPPWHLESVAVGHCWRNVPPATVWRIRRRTGMNGAAAD
jgi:phosphatidylethanolamine/phosphatidyl-N-methylethanolamine N-methyltransferase